MSLTLHNSLKELLDSCTEMMLEKKKKWSGIGSHLINKRMMMKNDTDLA